MSYFRDSPRFADRLRGMSDDELLREMKQRFNKDNGDTFFESSRPTRNDSFDRPFTHFPRGFPFEDDADVFERPRSDGIRAHLDDLAARHPEFAEHLRGPPWPFGGSLLRDRRRRRRGSGGSNDDQQQQGQQHQDEDTRSQASGSSAASGASAVSSHSGGGGEHDLTSSSTIPQYGLRNTMDIGQQQRRREMEMNPEKGERGQRSMSAPPESWQQQQSQQQDQDQQLPQPGQGQRFVSRVDITPQHNQQQQRAQSPNKPASNIRHIPIFVEGRDEPVLPKAATDDAPSSTFQHHHQRQPSPPSHHFDRSSPPAHHFHRPSHFNERFSRQQWPPSHFQDAFYKPAGFEQPTRRQFQQQHQQPQYYYQQPQYHQQQPQYQQQQHQQPQHHEQHYQQQQTQQPQPDQEQQQQQQETPKPKPPMPKDPLEKVSQVQKEVDDLAEQVRRYIGGSRQDKEYIYLDEMLTRELIKLDDIETEGRENVRQARKNAIKSIQDTISLLETKTPIVNQQGQQFTVHKEVQESAEKNQRGEETSHISEPMEIDAKQEKHSNEPIPLPPAPSSPTKTKVESLESENTATAIESVNQNIALTGQQDTEQKIENLAAENTKQPVASISTDESTKCADETSKESKPSDGKDGEQKDDDVSRTMTENKHAMPKQQTKEATEGKTEDGQRSSTESPRLQKKAKKTKKKEQQQPVSEQAIPLPPPPTESAK